MRGTRSVSDKLIVSSSSSGGSGSGPFLLCGIETGSGIGKLSGKGTRSGSDIVT
ncbi:hypothetical protein IMCC9480_3342 [Oxalobacteraceae bacterium IMCC9480]|nr:hypothetical protein IMCC9480_3342 [Oxalobacteraceae bacterium IMCC9480]